MYQITRFATLDIDLFFNLDEYRIIEDFGYGDISGIGKVCGYQILFFIFRIMLRHYQLMKL